MANKKLKLLYLARYLQEQTDEQHPKTVQDMIGYLADCGISAERKSLYDDLELLRVYGMDVQSVKSRSYGYFLGERDFQLPELKLLIDVVQASPFLTQSKSMELIGKLEKLTSRPYARQLRRQVYVVNRVKTHNERLYYAVDGLSTAINEGKKVTFRYFDWTAEGGKAYRRDGGAVRDESGGAVRGQALLSGGLRPGHLRLSPLPGGSDGGADGDGHGPRPAAGGL